MYQTLEIPKTQKTKNKKPHWSALLTHDENYLEYYDKLHISKGEQSWLFAPGGGYECLTGFVTGKCSHGHAVAKALHCDKEWCPSCGRMDSHIHKRRVARWWDKVMQMESLGYMVITMPDTIRACFLEPNKNQKSQLILCPPGLNEDEVKDWETANFKSVKKNEIAYGDLLRRFRLFVKRRLVDDGFKRGMTRWHWSGDCQGCRGNGCEDCEYTGSSDVWKPHLNIFIEADHLSPSYLYSLKKKCKRWFQRNLGFSLKHDTVIWYNWYTEKSQKAHKLRYNLRATWRYADNIDVLRVIKGFRTSQCWGKWEKTHERTSELVALENGKCHDCGDKLEWGKFTSIKKFNQNWSITREIDGGYFEISSKNERPPPEEINQQDLTDLIYGKKLKLFEYSVTELDPDLENDICYI